MSGKLPFLVLNYILKQKLNLYEKKGVVYYKLLLSYYYEETIIDVSVSACKLIIIAGTEL